MLTVTAKIGQAVARSAIGLREGNFYTRYTRKADGQVCSFDDAMKEGSAVSARKYSICEKARYGGSLPRLTRYGILLLIYIHFQDPDNNGLVRFFDPEEAAAQIGCTRRTVMNNLRFLSEGGYISMSRAGYAGIYNIFISDYQEYYKPASKGGRGYCAISRDFFTNATACRDINELRMTIRSIFDQNAEKKDRLPRDPEYIFYRNGLPRTVSTRRIKEIINGGKLFGSVFDTVPGKYNAAVSIKIEHDPMSLLPSIAKDCWERLCDHINCPDSVESPLYRVSGTAAAAGLLGIAKEISPLAGRYDLPYIFSAFDEFAKRYVLPGRMSEVKSPGACIRDIIKELIHKPGYIPATPREMARIPITMNA